MSGLRELGDELGEVDGGLGEEEELGEEEKDGGLGGGGGEGDGGRLREVVIGE